MRPTRDHELIANLEYNIELAAVDFNEKGDRIFLEGEDMKNAPIYSAHEWFEFDTFTQTTPDETGALFNGKINVPASTTPGTYYAAIITRAAAIQGDTGTVGARLDARAVANIVITIPGEVNENAELLSFKLDEKKQEVGDVVFLAEIKNESDLVIQPVGEITVYDSSGNQVMGVVLNTKEAADGTDIFVSEENSIKFNPNGQSIPPNNQKTVETSWINKNIKPGRYKAELETFYGREGVLKGELDLEITEDVYIKLNSEAGVNSSLPINFIGTINNNGTSGLAANVNFEIKNMFGSTVFSKNYSQLLIKSGDTFEISGLEWDEGFALGTYTAVLTMTYGDTGNELVAKAQFVVMNWWQIIIAIAVLLLIIFGIYKGISGYLKMKKKVSAMEHEKEETN
ncbi:hypothetical protein ACFL3T_01465 [Patescibacteria group bacterium]